MTQDMYGKTPLGWAKSRLARLKQSTDTSASLIHIQKEIASIINTIAEYCKKRGLTRTFLKFIFRNIHRGNRNVSYAP